MTINFLTASSHWVNDLSGKGWKNCFRENWLKASIPIWKHLAEFEKYLYVVVQKELMGTTLNVKDIICFSLNLGCRLLNITYAHIFLAWLVKLKLRSNCLQGMFRSAVNVFLHQVNNGAYKHAFVLWLLVFGQLKDWSLR